jgi:hypothetical protein
MVGITTGAGAGAIGVGVDTGAGEGAGKGATTGAIGAGDEDTGVTTVVGADTGVDTYGVDTDGVDTEGTGATYIGAGAAIGAIATGADTTLGTTYIGACTDACTGAIIGADATFGGGALPPFDITATIIMINMITTMITAISTGDILLYYNMLKNMHVLGVGC